MVNTHNYSFFSNMIYALKGAWIYAKIFYVYLFCNILFSAIQPFVNMLFIKWIIQALVDGAKPTALIFLLSSFLIVAVIAYYMVTWLQQTYRPSLLKVRMCFFEKLQEKCLTTDFVNTGNSDFLNKSKSAFMAMSINDAGIEGLLHKIYSLGGQLLAILIYIVIIGLLNGIVLFVLLLSACLTYYAYYKAKKFQYEKRDSVVKAERKTDYLFQVMNDFSYGKDIRLYRLAKKLFSEYTEQSENRLQIDREIQHKFFLADITDAFLFLLGEGAAYAYLIWQIFVKNMTVADFSFYFSAVSGFVIALILFFTDISALKGYSLEISEFRNFLEGSDKKESGSLSLPSPPYTLEFQNVSFKYPGADNYSLKNLNLTIPAKQKLGIVGHNGAGKTTFVKLLTRLYTPTEGRIFLNGTDIQCFDRNEYFQAITAVFQDVNIFTYSVAENVAFTETQEENKIWQSLNKAGISDVVYGLPSRLKTPLGKVLDGNGIELSGGQKQRIALARALFKEGEIIILDEPTAALDPIAENDIYTRFHTMVEEKTAIFISHRLASTRFCDQIAMFEDGKLIEYGTHEKLLVNNGKYADMFKLQAQYYKGEEAE